MKFFKLMLTSLSISLAGCAATGEGCQFNYTENMKESIVLPLLKEKVGSEMVPFFNVDNPVVTVRDKNTRIVVSPINQVDGKMVMYENSYVYVVNNCTGELSEFFEVVRN